PGAQPAAGEDPLLGPGRGRDQGRHRRLPQEARRGGVSQVQAARQEATGMIAITEAAAKEIQRQRDKRGTPGAAIRVGIRGGGCTGFSYLYGWEDGEPRATDKDYDAFGVRLVTDPKSH